MYRYADIERIRRRARIDDSVRQLGAIRRALDAQGAALSTRFPLLTATQALLDATIASLDADAARLGLDRIIFAPPACVYEYDDDRDQ